VYFTYASILVYLYSSQWEEVYVDDTPIVFLAPFQATRSQLR
jgi:hypothetical protein